MKIVHLLLIALLSMFLIGCGSDNSDSPTASSSTDSNTSTTDNTLDTTSDVTVSFKTTSTTTLTTNNQVVTIEVLVFNSDNAPYTGGTINIVYPNKATTGVDVGSFDANTKSVVNGKATFSYTAPDDLQARVDAGDTSTLFGFYHSSSKDDTIQTYTFNYAPAVNQIVLTDYELKNSSSSQSVTLGLQSTMQMAFYVQDTNGNKLADSSVTSIEVALLNASLATLKDTSGNVDSNLTFTNDNDVSVNIVSNTKSGIVPIRVVANFNDINGDPQTLTATYNVIILSGPPTAISMSYVSTTNDTAKAKFVEKWAVSVTDKYNNLVNTNPSVSMGMIAGYATSAVANNKPHDYLYYTPVDSDGVNSQVVANGVSDQLVATAGVFDVIDEDNDVLATFGQGFKFNASGKWDITKLNATTLTLIDNFEGNTTDDMGFAVGHNFRDETCDFGKKALGNVYPVDNIYTIDASGTIIVNVEYDYYLTGKDVVLWANMVGNQNSNVSGEEAVRIGHAQKELLRGLGLTGGTYSFASGYTGTVRFDIGITGTVEWYKNANFGCQVSVSGNGNTFTIPDTSMVLGVESCQTSGTGKAYIDVEITASASNGTITVDGCLPASEF